MQFEEFGLIEPLLRAVRFEGYTHPTPIQELAIPHVLSGKDLLGCAQTGTGKTAAFALPLLQRLATNPPAAAKESAEAAPAGHRDSHTHEQSDSAGHGGHRAHAGHGRKKPSEHAPHGRHAHRAIRVLVLSPTRELAAQIDESFAAYGRYVDARHTVIFGGVRQGSQVKAIQKGVDVLVATPGRLLDLMGQKIVRLDKVEMFVLDEADRMLDMGFIADIRRIIAALPTQRQTLMFSATMPHEIRHLADSILTDPVEVRVKPHAPAAETVEQTVYFVERQNKQALLEHVLRDPSITRALVFIRTKRNADRVAKRLIQANILADAIHSDRTQQARQRALKDFKEGRTRVLVASDIASRGLDVDDISHVINYDMPNEPETYVHRIGRTGRAGSAGLAISFCGLEERIALDDIQKLIRQQIQAVSEHPYASPLPPPKDKAAQQTSAVTGWHRPVKRNLLRGGRRR
jgi:ATP-dependent RNA helicase RhlE